jgi:hypothetical protein
MVGSVGWRASSLRAIVRGVDEIEFFAEERCVLTECEAGK